MPKIPEYHIRKFTPAESQAWLRLARRLWPQHPARELSEVFRLGQRKPRRAVFFVAQTEKKMIGFIYGTIRVDYVEGSDTSPVGYLEGIYVEPNHRKQGIAAVMMNKFENWVRARGCTELGSDAYATNKLSRKVHERLGFKPQPLIAPFLKKIA